MAIEHLTPRHPAHEAPLRAFKALTSYTPGPYAIGETGYITSTDRDHHFVAQVCHDRNGERHPANEALLAAAHELHQVLVEIMGDYRNDLAVIRPCTLKLIVSALAKVEGGAA